MSPFYDRGEVKQEMLDGMRVIVDAVRNGNSTHSVGYTAYSIANNLANKTFSNQSSFLFNNPPGGSATQKSIPLVVSTSTLVAAAKASTDTSSPRQAAIMAELTKRVGSTKANALVNDKKAKLKAEADKLATQLSSLQRQIAAI